MMSVSECALASFFVGMHFKSIHLNEIQVLFSSLTNHSPT